MCITTYTHIERFREDGEAERRGPLGLRQKQLSKARLLCCFYHYHYCYYYYHYHHYYYYHHYHYHYHYYHYYHHHGRATRATRLGAEFRDVLFE